MKITVYFGFIKRQTSYGQQFEKWQIECLSLNKSVVMKRLGKLSYDYYTCVKQRTLDTENLDEIKYLFK